MPTFYDEADGDDVTFHFAYDERWRVVATYRESDTSPKEQFIYHCAGADGMGGSSYIDASIMRDQDANSTWTSAADGALERRDYYCHNWRSDVVALIHSGGGMRGWVKYSAYGIPYGIPALDTNGDGVVNATDATNITNWSGTGAGVTNPTADYDLNGNIDSNDMTAYTTRQFGQTLGWGKLSQSFPIGGGAASGNRKGYAGYEFDPILADSSWHVRHRVLKSDLGRWTRRDPLGYPDGPNKFSYALTNPMTKKDPSGLACQSACAGSSCSFAWLNCEATFEFEPTDCVGICLGTAMQQMASSCGCDCATQPQTAHLGCDSPCHCHATGEPEDQPLPDEHPPCPVIHVVSPLCNCTLRGRSTLKLYYHRIYGVCREAGGGDPA